jgi:hypothetical protein
MGFGIASAGEQEYSGPLYPYNRLSCFIANLHALALSCISDKALLILDDRTCTLSPVHQKKGEQITFYSLRYTRLYHTPALVS